jgi:hypothetical protein
MLDIDPYSTIDFGSNVDLEVMDADNMQDDVIRSADSTENNRKIGSGGPRQYSDLLDVPTFE